MDITGFQFNCIVSLVMLASAFLVFRFAFFRGSAKRYLLRLQMLDGTWVEHDGVVDHRIRQDTVVMKFHDGHEMTVRPVVNISITESPNQPREQRPQEPPGGISGGNSVFDQRLFCDFCNSTTQHHCVVELRGFHREEARTCKQCGTRTTWEERGGHMYLIDRRPGADRTRREDDIRRDQRKNNPDKRVSLTTSKREEYDLDDSNVVRRKIPGGGVCAYCGQNKKTIYQYGIKERIGKTVWETEYYCNTNHRYNHRGLK